MKVLLLGLVVEEKAKRKTAATINQVAQKEGEDRKKDGTPEERACKAATKMSTQSRGNQREGRRTGAKSALVRTTAATTNMIAQ